MISFEEFLDRVQAKYKIDRGEAVSYARGLYEKGHPGFKNVYDVEDALHKERISSMARPVVEAGASALYPFAVAASPVLGMDIARKIEAYPKQFEPNPIPGADFIGGMVGSTIPFMAAEAAVVPVLRGVLAGAKGFSPGLLKILAGSESSAVLGTVGKVGPKETIPALASVGRTTRTLAPAIAGAGVGALYQPDQPLQGAAVGGALGLAGGVLNRYLNAPLRGVAQDPQLKEAIGVLASATHESPEVILSRLKTVAELNTELAKHGKPPVDVVQMAGEELTPFPSEPHDVVVPPSTILPAPTKSEGELAFDAARERMRRIVWPFGKGSTRDPTRIGALSEYDLALERERRVAESYQSPFESYERRVEAPTQKTLRMAQESLVRPVKDVQEAGAEALEKLKKTEPFRPGRERKIAKTVSDATGIPPFLDDYDTHLERLSNEIDGLTTSKAKASAGFKKWIKGGAPEEDKGLDVVARVAKDGRIVFLGMDTNPAEVFNDEASKGFLGTIANAGIFKRFRLPTSIFARDAASAGWKARELGSRGKYFYNIVPTIDRHWTKLRDLHNLKNPENFEEFARAHEGLKRVAKDGKVSLVQTAENIDPKMDTAAREYREKIVDRLWWIARGWRPKVEAILKELGMEADEKTIRRLDFIQKEARAGRGVPNVDRVEELAAQRTDRMIKLSPSHDLKGGAYEDGFFSFLPIANERAALEDRIASLEKEIDLATTHGASNPDAIKRFQAELGARKQRLDELEQQVAARNKAIPGQGGLPGRQFYGPLSMSRDPAAAPFMLDLNPDSVARRLVYNVINKRYFDEILHDARATLPNIADDGSIKRYMVDHIQMLRGVKGFLNDEWIRSIGANLGKYSKYFDEPHIRKFGSELMKLQVLTKLFASFRFPIANSTQTFLTVYPVVGGKIFGRALAKSIVDFSEFARLGGGESPVRDLATLARKGNVWAKAHFSGALGEGGERFLREVESFGPESILDKLISAKIPGTKIPVNPSAFAAEFTENFNRVIAHTAGEMSRLEPGWTPHPALKTYVPMKGRAVWRDAQEYGKAMVNATQFILGKEGKPSAFTGGVVQRLGGQFRTFSVAYTTLMKDLALNIKNDKGVGIARGIAALGFFAGLPGFPLYRTFRSQFIKQLGWVLPDYNGFSAIGQYTGIGAKVPHLLDVDVTTSVEPFNFPMSLQAKDLMSWIGGPTFGSLAHLVETGATEGPNSAQFLKETLRTIAPPLVNIGESVEEYKRGGTFTPAGNPLAFSEGAAHPISRAAGLTPSVKKGYYEYRSDLKDTISSGRYELLSPLIEQATKEGYVFSPKTLSAIKGEVTRDSKKHGWSFLGGEIFSK